MKAIVKPGLLLWARESAGLDRQQAASKIRVKGERLASWEVGRSRPTVIQLRNLARVYRRPLAVFYLPEPPKEFDALRDFRRLPGEVAGQQSAELRFAVRWAHYRRAVALDLYRDLGETPLEFPLRARLSADPEQLAVRIRARLGISYDRQTSWTGPYLALNSWRSALEGLGVLVFQARGVDVSEMRGFSIGDRPLPAVVLNIKDSPRGRVFTMLHELVHLALGQGGLCDLDEDSWRPATEQAVEVFCNTVSGAILVPTDCLLREQVVVAADGPVEWANSQIATLAGRYQVSWEVVLRRLLIAGRATDEFYRAKRRELIQYYEQKRRKTSPGYASPPKIALSTVGQHFARLVLNSYYQEKITARDVSDFFGVRLKHLAKIEEQVVGQSFGTGAEL